MPSINDIVLTHYSDKPVVFDDRVYEQDTWHKPRGLWLSDDSDYGWKEWCESEHFSTNSMATITEYSFAESANILWLKTFREILSMRDRYPIGSVEEYDYKKPVYQIDWPKVAQEYDGILITPYSWELRLNPQTSWYYPWDCASACVWNTSVLKVRERVE